MDNISAQEITCRAFGYNDGEYDLIATLNKTQKEQIEEIKDNVSLHCCQCGQIHKRGFASKKGSDHLLKKTISLNTTTLYHFADIKSNFICEYCLFANKNYKDKTSPMLNLLINAKGDRRYFQVKSNEDNELYDILKHPPTPPFVILINSRGRVLENILFKAEPSLSKEAIIVNYGLNNYYIQPANVFNLLDKVYALSEEHKVKMDSELFFNRLNAVEIKVPKKSIENSKLMSEVSNILLAYDRPTRVIAKMLLRRYLLEKEKSKSQTLF